MAPERIHTLVTVMTGSGRPAVLARYRPDAPWLQVDSCDSLRDAEALAGRLEGDKIARHDTIDQWSKEIWGTDAPLMPPA